MALPNRTEQKYSIETIQCPGYIKCNAHHPVESSNSIKIHEDEMQSWGMPNTETSPAKDYALRKQAIAYSAETSLQ